MVKNFVVLNVLQIKDELDLLSGSIACVDVFAEVEDQIQKICHFVCQYEIAYVFTRLVFFVEKADTDLDSFVILGHQHTNGAVLFVVVF